MTPSAQCCSSAGIVILVLTLFACSAEQPPSAANKLSPALQRTLQEMNVLGARENRQQTYAYALADTCDLRATKSLNAYPTKQMAIFLKDSRFERYDYSPGLGYAIRNVNPDAEMGDVVFEASGQASIQAMLALLATITTECLAALAPAGHPG